MNESTEKNILIFEKYISIFDELESKNGPLFNEKIESLLKRDVRTVFIISSSEVSADDYLKLVDGYKNHGFRVRTIHIGELKYEKMVNIHKIVSEIIKIYKNESTLILSYGNSFASMISACYHVFIGESPSRAIFKISRVDEEFINRHDEITMVYNFKRYLNEIDGVDDDEAFF